MKEYILFAGDSYYAKGGWHDFIGMHKSLDLALQVAYTLRDKDWWHIVDVETAEVVRKSECQAWGVQED